jgi:alpha-1,2-mannosyltransferase
MAGRQRGRRATQPDPAWPLRPHVLDYDLVVLEVAIAFFARHGLSSGFRSLEISLLAAAWIAPLLSRGVAGIAGIPLGLLVLLAMYVFTLRRAVLDRQGFTAAIPGIAQA